MKITLLHRRFSSLLCITALFTLLVTGCSAHKFSLPLKDLQLADNNPHPRADIKDGGVVKLPIQTFPVNFNSNQLNGASGDLAMMVASTMPRVFTQNIDGSIRLDTNYFTHADSSIHQGKQRIVYTINPHARWSDGTPITWKDLASQAHALSGKSPGYEVASDEGYRDIESVRPGVNERQAIVTLSTIHGEWQGLFAPLYPRSVQSTPEAFNTQLIKHTPPTAGPFRFHSIDAQRQIVILRKDPHWWGTPAKLDTIIFRQAESTSGIDPYLTHEFDSLGIGMNVSDITRASSAPHTIIQRAYSNQYLHITFNNSPHRLTGDVHVRRAIAQGIDRNFLFQSKYSMLTGKDTHITPLNNHFFFLSSPYYQDNAHGLTYDPQAAQQELVEAGWKMGSNGVRYKNGQQLRITMVQPAGSSAPARMLNQLIQAFMKKIGINLVIRQVPVEQYFSPNILSGNFDITMFIWLMTAFPISSSQGIYAIDPRCLENDPLYNPTTCSKQQNFGLQGTPRITHLFSQAMQETNPIHRVKIAQKIDTLLWQDMGQLPLYQIPLVMVTDSRLANYGITPSGEIDWVNVGWLKQGIK